MRAPDPLLTDRKVTTKRRDRALGLAPQERGTRVDKGCVLGYSWFRVDSAFVRHPKMLRLRAELSDQQADAYVVRLWAWSQVYAPSGRFDAALSYALEAELLWTGSPGSLAAAFEKCGWLDRIGEQFEVHDWPDFQEFHVKKSRKDADKKRKRRSRKSAACPQPVRMDGAAPSARTAPPTDGRDGRDGRTDGTDLFPADGGEVAKPASKEKVKQEATDPRHAPLVADLCSVFERERGAKYPFRPIDAKQVQALLKLSEPPGVLVAWTRALQATHPTTSSLLELVQRFPKYVGDEPTGKKVSAFAAADKQVEHKVGYVDF